MNERKCTAEALNLLGEYADKLYGLEQVSLHCLHYWIKGLRRAVFGANMLDGLS